MTDSPSPLQQCPRCGTPLPKDAVAGLCPRCLMAEAMLPTQAAPDSPPQQPVPTPGEIAPYFPQLDVMECLGRGGMGVIYKARQKSLNRLVALKLLAPERADDPLFAARFAREAQALAALNHPNIVAVYDFGQAGGFYYLLMEFVDGVNLRQILQSKRLTPKEALSIVPPVCEALQCAHDHGIVHRDIKPENLLIDKAGGVKIADFGIAKIIENGRDALRRVPNFPAQEAAISGDDRDVTDAQQHVPTLGLGTPDYAAPEQSEGSADHRTDIYSLGVVLYEMLTGERPQQNIVPPSKRVQVDVRIDNIVLRALEKTPELRYQTAVEFRTQVEKVAGQTATKMESAWKAPDSGWGWLIGKMFGFTFTSRRAFQLANLSALGFLAFLGFVPLPGWQACFGFAGFFGLIGLANIVEFFARRSSLTTARQIIFGLTVTVATGVLILTLHFVRSDQALRQVQKHEAEERRRHEIAQSRVESLPGNDSSAKQPSTVGRSPADKESSAGGPVYRSLAKIVHQSRLNGAKPDADLAKEAADFYRVITQAMESEALKKNALERVKTLQPDLKVCPVAIHVMQSQGSIILDVFATGSEPKFVRCFLDALLDEFLSARRQTHHVPGKDTDEVAITLRATEAALVQPQ